MKEKSSNYLKANFPDVNTAESTWQRAKHSGWSSLGLLAAANNNNLSRGGLEITPIKFYVAIKGIFMCAHQQVIWRGGALPDNRASRSNTHTSTAHLFGSTAPRAPRWYLWRARLHNECLFIYKLRDERKKEVRVEKRFGFSIQSRERRVEAHRQLAQRAPGLTNVCHKT